MHKGAVFSCVSLPFPAWPASMPPLEAAHDEHRRNPHFQIAFYGDQRSATQHPPNPIGRSITLLAKKKEHAMFGLFKKKIPAPECERAAIVKRLWIFRYENDPEVKMMVEAIGGCDPDEFTGEELMQFAPEATILRVVEQFLSMKDQGATDEFAIRALNQLHSSVLSTVGEDVSILQQASTLFQYVRHIVDALHGHGSPISDHFLIDSIQDIKSYYKR